MTKKIYFLIGVLVLIILVTAVICRQSQKVVVSPIEKDLTAEEESFEQDINELEELSQDTSLDDLEEGLTEITEEKPVSGTPETEKIETVSIENLESELASELSSFSDDLNDLGELEGDTSLDNLDTRLSGISE